MIFMSSRFEDFLYIFYQNKDNFVWNNHAFRFQVKAKGDDILEGDVGMTNEWEMRAKCSFKILVLKPLESEECLGFAGNAFWGHFVL